MPKRTEGWRPDIRESTTCQKLHDLPISQSGKWWVAALAQLPGAAENATERELRRRRHRTVTRTAYHWAWKF